MLFQSDAFSSAFIHAIEYAACGGANLSECLEASTQIKGNDRESWHRAWVTLAERVRRQAALALSQRRKREAHATFLRAAQYYRNAGWFMGQTENDARRATLEKASATCFATALRLDETIGAQPELTALPAFTSAHLYRSDFANDPFSRSRPTAVIVGDCGTSPMTLYFACAPVITRCGWNCVIASLEDDFDEQNTTLPQLIDATARLPYVDPSCLALATFRENETVFRREVGSTYCRFLFCERAMGSANEITAATSRTSCARLAPSVTFEGLTELHEHLLRWLGASR